MPQDAKSNPSNGLVERVARIVDPDAWERAAIIARYRPELLKALGVQTAESLSKAREIHALYQQEGVLSSQRGENRSANASLRSDASSGASPGAEPSALVAFIDDLSEAAITPGAVVWVPAPLEQALKRARWNIQWLLKIARDKRLTKEERVGIIANFPDGGIEPVYPADTSAEPVRKSGES